MLYSWSIYVNPLMDAMERAPLHKTALIGTIFLVLGLAIAGLAVGGIYDEMYPNPATTTLYVRGHRI